MEIRGRFNAKRWQNIDAERQKAKNRNDLVAP